MERCKYTPPHALHRLCQIDVKWRITTTEPKYIDTKHVWCNNRRTSQRTRHQKLKPIMQWSTKVRFHIAISFEYDDICCLCCFVCLFVFYLRKLTQNINICIIRLPLNESLKNKMFGNFRHPSLWRMKGNQSETHNVVVCWSHWISLASLSCCFSIKDKIYIIRPIIPRGRIFTECHYTNEKKSQVTRLPKAT